MSCIKSACNSFRWWWFSAFFLGRFAPARCASFTSSLLPLLAPPNVRIMCFVVLSFSWRSCIIHMSVVILEFWINFVREDAVVAWKGSDDGLLLMSQLESSSNQPPLETKRSTVHCPFASPGSARITLWKVTRPWWRIACATGLAQFRFLGHFAERNALTTVYRWWQMIVFR